MVGTMNGVNGNHPDSILPDSGFAFQISPSSPTREAAASFVQKKLDEIGAQNRPYSLPNNGEDVLPHAVTFGSMMAGYSSVYLLPEEAVDGMGQDARLMRHDVGIMECIEIRQRLVAELDWSIEPEDSKHPGQKALAAELTKIINRIRRFTEYRRSMQEAVWVGRAGIQHRYGTVEIGGAWRRMPKPVHKDHCGWKPINGDKIVFRYDDGREMRDGAFADQMGIRVHTAHFPKSLGNEERKRIEPTAHGMAYFLTHEERDTILIHKHMIEDADFNDVRTAGRIHGVGIRDRIRKEWILKQETLAFMMSYLERSAGGIEIWEYPSGDTAAKNACIESAKNRSANGRNILFFPKPIGEDASAYDLKIVEPGFSGIDLINTLQDKFFGHRIKRYIIGQTLTTEADATGMGSGVADAHKDTLSQIILYDGVNHEETLTEELVRPIQLLNFPETSHWRMALKLQFESDDSKEKLEGIRTAWDMGARISEQDVLDQIGTAVPTPEDRVLLNPAFQPGAGGMGAGGGGGAGGPGATGGLSPFGTLSGGTSVVKAGVHQAMGAEVSDSADPLNPGRQVAGGGPGAGRDGDGDGWSGDGTNQEKFTGAPQKYARRSDRLLSEAATATHATPSPGQLKAGNYSKGSFPWKGLMVKIENPKGSERHGTSASGREWSRTMACHYGYFQRTKASDGDALDVFIGSHPDSEFVLVIKQVDQDGKFDEFKVVIGCTNRKQAKKLYLANYPEGWKCGPAASMTVEEFKRWVARGGPVKAASIKVES